MPAEELRFVLPAGSERASGGNVYNRELVRALRALSAAPDAATPGGSAPSISTLTAEEFRRSIERGEAGLYFVDTLNLREAEGLTHKTPEQHTVLVVHHLPSLEPGISPEDPAIGLERAALPLFDRFLVTSDFTADLLVRRGFSRERIMTVEPGLPAVELGPAATESPLRALLVGNLIARKGIRDLLFALAASVQPTDAFSLDIVGHADLDPAYAETVGRVITRTSALAERVRWHSTTSYEEMSGHYRQASVLISAASMETFGMALAEARAYGVPILALDGGYVSRQFTDGLNGRLFKSITALVDEFLRLVRDATAMQALFASARLTATPGPETWDRAARRLLEQL
jgi:glycosyltransferase involved in cell wall biosynthesis